MAFPVEPKSITDQIFQKRKNRRKRNRLISKQNDKTNKQKKRVMHTKEKDMLDSFGQEHTYWYKAYVLRPDVSNPKFQNQFRIRFRIPYDSYLFLLHQIDEDEIFIRWKKGRLTRSMKNPQTRGYCF